MFLPLAGCYADQEKQVATCEIEARRAFPDVDPTKENAFNPWSTPFGHSMELCMQAHGYERNVLDERCSTYVTFILQAGCYAPSGHLDRLIF
jgi:hypothetical protein